MRIQHWYWKGILILLGLGLLFSLAQPAQAADPAPLSETSLIFKGKAGEILQRSVILTPEQPLTQVQVVVSDLVDPNGAVILGEKAVVDPAQLDALDAPQRFTVTLGDTSRAGQYRGELRILAAEQNYSLPLEVSIAAIPSVDTDVNSKSITLYSEPGFWDMPFRPAAAGADLPLNGEVALSLVQAGDTPATIQSIKVLALHGSEGRTLPEGAVLTTMAAPLEIGASDAVTVYLQARGRSLRAGEYNGTVLVAVENQSQPVQIPLRVLIKDGPLLALLLLAFGPIIGLLFTYWRSNGQALFDLRRRILALQNEIRGGRNLTIEDQRSARRLLGQAMSALTGGGETAQVESLLQQIKDNLAAARTHAVEMTTQLDQLTTQVSNVQIGLGVRKSIMEQAEAMSNGLQNGGHASWQALDNQMKTLGAETEALLEANRKLSPGSVDPNKLVALNQAKSMQELNALLTRDLSPIGKGGLESAEAEAVAVAPEWTWFSLRLQVGRLAVGVVIYLFTLAVGWVTLYSAAPTFGANREDYITLFLWGVASNAVGGQALDLKAILGANADREMPTS